MGLVLFALWVLCGIAGAKIAAQKGRSVGGWAVLCLLFGPFGVMLALVSSKDEATLTAQALASGDSRQCPQCAELVKAAATKCRYCGSTLAPLPKPSQPAIAGTCFLCGFALPEPVDTCPKCGRKDPLARPAGIASRCLIVLGGASLLFTATPSWAQANALVITNGGGGLACFNKKAIDEAMTAAVADDVAWIQNLIDRKRCFIMKSGLRATSKDINLFGPSQIYLHGSGGKRVTVWTVTENFKLAR